MTLISNIKNLTRFGTFLRCTNSSVNSTGVRRIVSNSFTVQTAEDFQSKVIKSDKPIIVDFYATWCKPCKMLAPRLESVIDEKKGKILLAKVDVDAHSDIALDYDISSIPVVIAFRDGEPVDRLIGLQDEDILRTFVNKYAEK